jgi:prolipoprotein diacylglyceryl transferase
MIQTVSVLGVTFHLYGFILGLAILLGYWLFEKRLRAVKNFPTQVAESLFLVTLFGGIVGARVWHLVTDFYRYQHNYWEMLAIWNGGLSILGGLLGGMITLMLAVRWLPLKKGLLLVLLDTATFGLPFAQALGRSANWVNQELYGKPTNNVFKLYIAPEFRLAGYENVAYYHPLFLYEAFAMTVFGIGLWWMYARYVHSHSWVVGSGKYALLYATYYSAIRFCLDFLRLDKQNVIGPLGINQVIIGIIVLPTLIYFWYFMWRSNRHRTVND